MPVVTVKPLVSVSTSLPVVKVTVRAPVGVAGSILRTAVAVVDELTVKEATVMPAPNAAVLVP